MINSFTGKYRFLSNFYPSPMEIAHNNGDDLMISLNCATVEHAYQAWKTFDQDQAYNISMAKTPGIAKRLGRTVKLRPDWDDIKLDVMEFFLTKKFQDTPLTNMLLGTGDQELVEGNYWHDNYWGACTCNACSIAMIPTHNNLGKMLMQLRSDLK